MRRSVETVRALVMRQFLVFFIKTLALVSVVGVAVEGANYEKPLANQEVEVLGFEYLHKKDSLADNEEEIIQFLRKAKAEISEGKIVSLSSAVKPDVKDIVYFKKLESGNEAIRLLSDRVLKLNREKPIALIHIVGHTDSDQILAKPDSKIQNNQQLSEFRASAVASALKEQGISIPLSYEGRAEREPLDPAMSEEAKAKNRRTEVYVYFDRATQNPGQTLLAEISCDTSVSTEKTQSSPLRLTLDGKNLDKNEKEQNVDVQRCQDVSLEKAKMQVHFNPRKNEKRLSLLSEGLLGSLDKGLRVAVYSNYLNFIEKAELLYQKYDSKSEGNPYEVIPFQRLNASFNELLFKPNTIGSYKVKLKVYAKDGTFDETQSRILSFVQEGVGEVPALYSLWGESELALSGISVASAGSVWVNGKGLAPEHEVYVMGRRIPLDLEGKFVEEQLLESGKNYGVTLVIRDKETNLYQFQRDLYIPEGQFFLVAIADATLGYNFSSKKAQAVTQDNYHFADKVYLDARTAFYLKGKIKGKYILTAQADTKEGPIDEIFSNFMSKDPQALARRIDPDEFYPVYGDDSTLTEEAPTSGKFYVKIEQNKNYFMWGNFKINYGDTVLARENRSYYGAQLNIDEGQIKSGESKSKLNVYAADPGTLAGRQDFRGGSSQYWIRNRDIVQGSEQVMVEVRDAQSSRVLKRRTLKYGEDYDINYIQGHLSLSEILSSTADSSGLVQAGAYSGNPVYLVVTYEYIPGFESLSDWSLGGRATQWVGDVLRLGATAHKDTQGLVDHERYGLDLKVNLFDRGSLSLEGAATKGAATAEYTSLDGGYNFNNPNATLIGSGELKKAFFAELDTRLYSLEVSQSQLRAYYKQKEESFSAPGESTVNDKKESGFVLNAPINSSLELLGKYDFSNEKNVAESQMAQLQLNGSMGSLFYYEIGALHDTQRDLSSGTSSTVVLSPEFGERLDSGLKLGIKKRAHWNLYGLGQKTLSRDATRSRNNRYGAGAEYSLTKKFSLGGELTDGDKGLAAKAAASYQYDDKTKVYNSYLLENSRSDTGLRTRDSQEYGQLASGIQYKSMADTRVNYENKYIHGDRPSGLTHTFGLDFTLTENWRLNSGAEFGTLVDSSKQIENKRQAYSLGFDYSKRKMTFGSQFEFRKDENKTTTGTDDRNTFVSRSKFNTRVSDDWRALAKFSYSKSTSSKGDFYDGDFIDGSLGFAYRAAENDRLNMLFKYRFFELEPSAGQVDSSGNLPEFRQRDHILSVDSLYDLTQKWSLGLKYAVNFSSLKQNRINSSPWFSLQKHLAIFRLEYHLLKEWDFIGEARNLWLTQQSQTQSKLGTLLGLYKILGEKDSFRLGVGYNFSSFSDDLTENDYNYQGIFVNAIGVF